MTELDPKRIAELERVMGDQLAMTLDSLERSIGASIGDIEAALDASDVEQAAYAAHRCRNDALIVGAVSLQRALSDLEAASRRSDLPAAREGLVQVLRHWPAARAQIRIAARQRQPPQ